MHYLYEKAMDKLDASNAEIKRLRAALEDIRDHSVEPFTGLKWHAYANDVACAALKKKESK